MQEFAWTKVSLHTRNLLSVNLVSFNHRESFSKNDFFPISFQDVQYLAYHETAVSYVSLSTDYAGWFSISHASTQKHYLYCVCVERRCLFRRAGRWLSQFSSKINWRR